MSTTEPVPPVVCTLTRKELVVRGLEWSDLSDLALTSEAIDGGVASTYPAELTDKLADLVNREMSCCGTWMNSTVEQLGATEHRGKTVRLELTTTNPDGLDLIRRIAGLPTTRGQVCS